MVDRNQRRDAFGDVVATVDEPLRRYLRRRCAPADFDDLFNEVLTVIWRRLDDTPPTMVLPWCYGIARRCLANHYRGTKRQLRLVRQVTHTMPEPSIENVTDADVALHEALAELNELDREVVRLWAWEQLEPREIATVLDTSPNAVSVRLTRIRRTLKI